MSVITPSSFLFFQPCFILHAGQGVPCPMTMSLSAAHICFEDVSKVKKFPLYVLNKRFICHLVALAQFRVPIPANVPNDLNIMTYNLHLCRYLTIISTSLRASQTETEKPMHLLL